MQKSGCQRLLTSYIWLLTSDFVWPWMRVVAVSPYVGFRADRRRGRQAAGQRRRCRMTDSLWLPAGDSDTFGAMNPSEAGSRRLSSSSRPAALARPIRTTLTSEVPVGQRIACRRFPLSFRGTKQRCTIPRRALSSLGDKLTVHHSSVTLPATRWRTYGRPYSLSHSSRETPACLRTRARSSRPMSDWCGFGRTTVTFPLYINSCLPPEYGPLKSSRRR